jgi:PAS domain S-box-containing protein
MGSVMGVAETIIQTSLLGEAVDTGPALVFVGDEEMRYIAVNQRACDALGYTRDELLGLHVPDVARATEAPTEYDEMLVRGFRNGTSVLTRKDGTTVDFDYRAGKTRVARLEVFVSIGFVRDG